MNSLDELEMELDLGDEIATKISAASTLKRLSVPYNRHLALSKLVNLEQIELSNVLDLESLGLNVIGGRLRSVSLSGPSFVVSNIDDSIFSSASIINISSSEIDHIGLSSSSSIKEVQYDGNNRRASSESYSTVSLTYGNDATEAWLEDKLCNHSNPNAVTSLSLSYTGTNIAPPMPTCVFAVLPNIVKASFLKTRVTDYVWLPNGLEDLTIENASEDPDQPSANTGTILSDLLNSWVNLRFLNINNPRLNGTFPATVNRQSTPILEKLLIGYSNLVGTLPPTLFESLPALKIFDVEANQLSGALPTGHMGSLQAAYLGSNKFSSWPAVNATGSQLTLIGLFDNEITSLPDEDAFLQMTKLCSFDVRNNPTLSGPLPPVIQDRTCSTFGLRTYDFSNCSFTGPITGSLTTINTNLRVSLSHNQLTALADWNGTLAMLDLDNNPNLTGTLDLLPFTVQLDLRNTSVSGLMSSLKTAPSGSSALQRSAFLVDETAPIDYCSGWSSPNISFAFGGDCQVYAISCDCAARYSSCIKLPSNSSRCVPCSGRAPDSTFHCILGTWYNPGTVTNASVLIGPNAGPVLIGGDLISNTTSTVGITFDGTSSTLTVRGCIGNLSTVNILLGKDEVERFSKSSRLSNTSLLFGDLCYNTSQDDTGLTYSLKQSSCRKVTGKLMRSTTTNSFGVYFTVDSSKCNVWWIIVVSVVGGLVVIAVIVVIILAVTVPVFRNKIRPFSHRKKNANAVG